MPYSKIDDLPKNTAALPRHAKEIFMKAFNSAWEEYGHDDATAQKVAWSAVKKKYAKDEKTGKWIEKSL